MPLLTDLIEKYGADAIENALKDKGEASAGEAFNPPSLKIGDTPASPQDFSQLATAQSDAAPFTPIDARANRQSSLEDTFQNHDESAVPRDAASSAATLYDSPQAKLDLLRGKTPNMTPLKPEPDPIDLSGESTPDPVNDSSTSVSTPLAAAGAAAGIGALAIAPGSPQAQSAPPMGMAASLKSRSGDNTDTSAPDDEGDEEGDINEKPSANKPQAGSSQNPASKMPAAPSKPQNLADLLSNTDPNAETYQDMQHKSALATLGNQLGEAGNIIGSAFARAPVNAAASKQFAEQTAQAQNMPKEFLQAKAAEETDPNSAVSKNYREFLAKQGLQVGPGVTAQQIKEVLLPAVDKDKAQKEREASQLQLKQLGLAQIKATKDLAQSTKEQARQDKLSKDDENEFGKVGKEASYLTASSKTALGQATTAKIQAQRLHQLLSDPNATNQDLNTGAALMNRIESGTATIGGTKDQEYNNLKMQAAKGLSYISSNPTAPDVPEVKKHMMDVADRMSKISDNVIDYHLGGIKNNHPDLYKRRPDDFNKIINYGMASAPPPPDKSKDLTSEDKKAIDWAQKNPDDSRAKQILQMHGIQ